MNDYIAEHFINICKELSINPASILVSMNTKNYSYCDAVEYLRDSSSQVEVCISDAEAAKHNVDICVILAHELFHAKQYLEGRLHSNSMGWMYLDRFHPVYFGAFDYGESDWEKDAYAYEVSYGIRHGLKILEKRKQYYRPLGQKAS